MVKILQFNRNIIKKCIFAFVAFAIMLCVVDSGKVYASEKAISTNRLTREEVLMPLAVKTINTTITDTMSQGGCWAQVIFKVSGSYAYNGNNLLNANISTSIKSAPSDWTVVIDSTSWELSGTNLIIKINYHYKASYFDCAYTGGYVYTMVQNTV